MRTRPWHSILSPVHHNNTECNTGNNIEWKTAVKGPEVNPSVVSVALKDRCVGRTLWSRTPRFPHPNLRIIATMGELWENYFQ